MEDFFNNLAVSGYHKFSNVLPPSLVIELRRGIDQAIERDKQTGKTFGNYSYIAQNKGECFVQLLELSPLQDFVDALLSSTCILHSYNTISLRPNIENKIQNKIHRDSPRFCRPYLLSVQILYMVDDFTKENGATYVCPGSHLYPDRPSDFDFFKNSIQLEGSAGDAVVFDSMLWHAGGVNITEQPRRGITKVFTRAFMKQQIDYTKATELDVVRRLSQRSRRLLGFDARVPEDIEQFLLPEENRLYKANQG